MTKNFKERKELRKLCQNLAKGNWQKLAKILLERNKELLSFTAKELCKRTYPVNARLIEEEDPEDNYFIVYMPAFGESACSATGNTLLEAMSILEKVKEDVFYHFLETGRRIPDPTEKPQH